jgi:hypothetical protein
VILTILHPVGEKNANKLHHLTPLGILHIVAIAYMGIEPHFDLWNYFFCTRLRPSSDVEAAVWGSVDISVQSRSGVDPYIYLSMLNPLVRSQKEWFFQWNDADALVPLSLGNHLVP